MLQFLFGGLINRVLGDKSTNVGQIGLIADLALGSTMANQIAMFVIATANELGIYSLDDKPKSVMVAVYIVYGLAIVFIPDNAYKKLSSRFSKISEKKIVNNLK